MGVQNIGLALQICELLLCRPRGESMTTEVRTNTFTFSEPLHTASSAYVLRTQPPANTPCDTIDTDYRFCLLKNMLCGSMEMSGKAPRQQDLLGIYRSIKAAFQGGRGRRKVRVRQVHQNAATVPHFTPEQELISGKFAYMCICTDPIWPQVTDTIHNGMPPNVSAVTNTRGLGKWREGSLSLEKITFEAQRRVHADGVLRQRSGPFVLSTTTVERVQWIRGELVTPARTVHLFTCVSHRWRFNYPRTAAAEHMWSLRTEQIFLADVWPILSFTVKVARRSPRPRGEKTSASASVDLHMNIHHNPAVLVSRARDVSFSRILPIGDHPL